MPPIWRPTGLFLRLPRSIAICCVCGKAKSSRDFTNGLTLLAKQRKVTLIQGDAKFVGPHCLEVKGAEGTRRVDFKQCIIAAGSESALLPGCPRILG